MFWAEAEAEPTSTDTPADLETYTHIVHLDVSAERVCKQRRGHECRKDRADDSVKHIKEHMQREMTKLRELCVAHGIFFTSVQEPRSASDEQSSSLQPDVARLLTDFVAVPREEIKYVNASRALSILDEQLRAAYATATTLLYPCHCSRTQPARYQNVARSRSKSRTVVFGAPYLRSRSMEAVLTSDTAAIK